MELLGFISGVEAPLKEFQGPAQMAEFLNTPKGCKKYETLRPEPLDSYHISRSSRAASGSKSCQSEGG